LLGSASGKIKLRTATPAISTGLKARVSAKRNIPKPGVAGSSPAGIANESGHLSEIEVSEKSH
jgi:hypothetical protein